MAVTLTINNIPYSFPDQGANPPWGTNVTTWATAITNFVTGFVSVGDILQTTFALTNAAPATNVLGFTFDSTTVRSFNADYSIYRVIKDNTNAITQEYVEEGLISGAYKNGTNSWEFTQQGLSIRSTGVTLSITASGQIQYTSTDITPPVGGSQSIKMGFRARTTAQ